MAALLASVVPAEGVPVVVELGPGTGAVSAAIAARLPRAARHLAIELDPAMAEFLRRHQTDMEVINGDARDLGRLLAARDIGGAAAVVSGLPWSLFDAESHERILRQVAAAIGTEGAFTTFAYTHTTRLRSARNFRRTLGLVFDEVQISRMVWHNVPPAFVYVCRRPRTVLA